MDKHDGGIIGFYEIAEIINKNAYEKTQVTPRKCILELVEDLSRYLKTLQNTGFNEEEFKKLCLD